MGPRDPLPSRSGALAALVLCLPLACATTSEPADERERTARPAGDAVPPTQIIPAPEIQESAALEAEGDSAETALVWDPFERVNRGIFGFNESLDRWVLEPVATGWDFVAPRRVQISLSNFFEHLVLPVRFVNDILQLKFVKASDDLARFIANTLFIAGLFDTASWGGIPKHDEDFGQTLGHWGMPPGPYLVLPILGPSNPRDGVGLAVDSAMAVHTFFISWYILVGAAATDAVNTRSLTLEQVRAEREAAFDFYTAVRGAYSQFRENRVHDRSPDLDAAAEGEEDLYYFEEDEETGDE